MLSRLPSLRFAATLALCAIASCAVACAAGAGDDAPADDPGRCSPVLVGEAAVPQLAEALP